MDFITDLGVKHNDIKLANIFCEDMFLESYRDDCFEEVEQDGKIAKRLKEF